MAKKRSTQRVDVGASVRRWADQFRGLNTNDPSVWPPLPRYALFLLIVAAANVNYIGPLPLQRISQLGNLLLQLINFWLFRHIE